MLTCTENVIKVKQQKDVKLFEDKPAINSSYVPKISYSRSSSNSKASTDETSSEFGIPAEFFCVPPLPGNPALRAQKQGHAQGGSTQEAGQARLTLGHKEYSSRSSGGAASAC